jgi:hypothetical protein
MKKIMNISNFFQLEKRKKKLLSSSSSEHLLEVITLFFATFLSFRSVFLTGTLPGDIGDARGNVVVLDHWYRVFTGKDQLNSFLLFYPADNVLGNSDALFLQGTLYTFLHLVGLSPVKSTIGAEILFALIGFIGASKFLKEIIKNQLIRNFCLILIANSYPFITAMVHPQLIGFLFIFWFAYFVIKSLRKNSDSLKNLLLAVIVCEILALSSWTPLISTIIYLLTFGFTYLIVEGWQSFSREIKCYFMNLQTNFMQLRKSSLILLLGLIFTLGFFWLRIYIFNITQGNVKYDLAEITAYSPRYGDLLNASSGAFGPWTRIYDYFGISTSPTGERALGYPPVLFLTSIVLFCTVVLRNNKTILYANYAKLFLTTNFIVLALIITDDANRTPWFFVYNIFPVIGSIRTLFRINILLTFILICIIGLILQQISLNKPRKKFAIFAFMLILFIESIRIYPASWKESDYLPHFSSRIMREMDKNQCKFFFIVSRNPSFNPSFLANDAIAISVESGIPTLNGNSSSFPPGWELYGVNADTYKDPLDKWLKLNKLTFNSKCLFFVD